MERIVKVLGFVVIILVLVVFSLSLVAIAKNKNEVETLNTLQSSQEPTVVIERDSLLFGDIGTIRAKTKDGIPVVIEPYLEYPITDVAFQEELVKKKVEMRELIAAYFIVRTYEEVSTLPEENIKKSLLELINNILTLNTIEKIYFEKYIIVK